MSLLKEKKEAMAKKTLEVLNTRTIKPEEVEMVNTIKNKLGKLQNLSQEEINLCVKIQKRKKIQPVVETPKIEEAPEVEEVIEVVPVMEETIEEQEKPITIEDEMKIVKERVTEKVKETKQKFDELKPKAKGFFSKIGERLEQPSKRKDIVIGVIVTVALGAIGL